MKYKFICIVSMVATIFGCTTSQIKDSLKEHPRANQYTTATILPVNLEDRKFAECVQVELKDDLPNLKFIPGDEFRDAMFPWFETNTAPKDIEALAVLLNRTLVKKRIESLGVELLISVHGKTKADAMSGDSAGIYLHGVTHICAVVWDLKETARVGDTDISFEGSGVIFPLGLPIFIPDASERLTCSETAKRISNCLTGKVSGTDKQNIKGHH